MSHSLTRRSLFARSLFAALAGVVSLLALAPLAARAQRQVPFVDTFSAFGRDTQVNGTPEHTFDGFSAWRTDTGGYNGGLPGFTSMRVNDTFDGAHVEAYAMTVAPGFFSARTYASMLVTNAQEQGYLVQSSHGTHTSVQFFAPATPARAQFHWRMTGFASSSDPSVYAGGTLTFAAGSYPTRDYYDFFNSPDLLATAPGNYSVNIATTLNQPIDLFYHSIAYAIVSDTGISPLVGQDFFAEADFGNTFELERIDLFDASDNRLLDWTMVDLPSGLVMFDQNGRTANAGGSSAAPEPATIALVGVGCWVLGVGRRRRRA